MFIKCNVNGKPGYVKKSEIIAMETNAENPKNSTVFLSGGQTRVLDISVEEVYSECKGFLETAKGKKASVTQ